MKHLKDHTPDEIRKMEAGPKMDVLVAQSLGWRAWKERRDDFILCVIKPPGKREPWLEYKDDEANRYEECSCLEAFEVGFFGKGFPPFSTSIADAWRVVEKMLGDYEYVLNAHRAKHRMTFYSRQFDYFGTAAAANPATAINRAALIAILGEGE